MAKKVAGKKGQLQLTKAELDRTQKLFSLHAANIDQGDESDEEEEESE